LFRPKEQPMTDPSPQSPQVSAATAETKSPDAPVAVVALCDDTASYRYVLSEEIAHGGMGMIYRATDTVLSREVAVKVLHGKHGPDSAVAQRFADEARITAQLQHPAIPPVHDLGTLPDGRPFLAMKLIKGQTLENLLAALPDPSAERARFVAVFEQVCQAVAYSHAHDVIHRDLKPANVMVGAFGEVQLMDWGLAKVLGAQPVETADPEETRAATLVLSLRDSEGSLTQAGSVLGTPAFMPPEQAAGVVGRVDQRSDVFGLGAILAVILTGKPPFAAESAEMMRGQAALGDVTECFARLDGCGAEPELVALCKRCLSPKPTDRPANGGEVAAAVAGLRHAAEERARAAELERIASELRSFEERKRRRVKRALALVVALLLMGGLAFGWWQFEQGRIARERRARHAEVVSELLLQCERALRDGNTAEASLTLESARKRTVEEGVQEQAERLARCERDLNVLFAIDTADQTRWTVEGAVLGAQMVQDRYRLALNRFFDSPDGTISTEAMARLGNSTVRERVLSALDWLLRAQRSDEVRSALRLLDSEPFRDAVRDAARADDQTALAKLATQKEALVQPAGFLASLGESEAIGLERRRELLQTALQQRPGDVRLLMALGGSYPINQRQGAEERVRWYQAAVAVAPEKLAAHLHLATALHDKGDKLGAVAVFRQVIRNDYTVAVAFHSLLTGNAAFRQALRLEPSIAVKYFRMLAEQLQDKGGIDGAIAAYKEAIHADPKSFTSHIGLGNALKQKGDPDGAIAAYKEAIRLDPKSSVAHNNLGNALVDKGDRKGALAAYQEANRFQSSPTPAHYSLGNALRAKEDLEGAIAAFREAIRHDPKYAGAHVNLGATLLDTGDLEGVITAYTEALRLNPKTPPAHVGLGIALERKGDLGGAIGHYQEILRLGPNNTTVSDRVARLERMRELLPRLPDLLASNDKPNSPVEACDFAILISQPFQKRYVDAVRLYADAFAADPKLAEDLDLKMWGNLSERGSHRYNAACCAALAGCGKGADAEQRKDKEKERLRAQALEWLRADLVLLRRQAGSSLTVQRWQAAAKLSNWLKDSDFTGVRPGPNRIALPTEERDAWDKLWDDVKATRALAQKTPTALPGN
jgi:serine/threonine protein kinase/cytochrome c-type biogenesis protein CcmH/NrfG